MRIRFSQSNNVLQIWTGGQPPYVIQTAADLVNPIWQNLGAPATNTSLLFTPSNAAASIVSRVSETEDRSIMTFLKYESIGQQYIRINFRF